MEGERVYDYKGEICQKFCKVPKVPKVRKSGENDR